MSVTTEESAGAAAIRPFTVEIPEAEIEALRARVAATRWPHKELVNDWSQGVQLAMLQELARYWAADYDWRRCEAELNGLPQFTTEIDGLGVHFIHVKSPHENALPLIITHGWPGSVIEMLGVIGPLTDPTAHGGTAEDAFDLVIPSLPGYGFSEQPPRPAGTPPCRQAWAELMNRLGYTRYVAQGGDQGAGVTDAMAPPGTRRATRRSLQLPVRRPARTPDGRASTSRLAFSGEDREQSASSRRLHARLHRRDGRAPADDRLPLGGLTDRHGGVDAGPRRRQLREDLPRLSRRASLRAASRGTTSSTTSRCTG